MEFSLFYRGQLKSNGRPEDKQAIRRVFHSQLKDLWSQSPLKDHHRLLTDDPKDGNVSVIRQRADFRFAPLVCEALGLVAELSLDMLWPANRGSIITSGGDIDNRIKTLLDALKYPSEPNSIPKGESPGDGEDPFFCLLEDDSLVTRLSVQTDRLLEPVAHPSEVVLLIRVRTRAVRAIYANIGLG